MSSISDSYDALRASNNIYHLLRARAESGDREVVLDLASKFMEYDGLSFLDAAERAVHFVVDLDRTIKNELNFKDMRSRLQQGSAQEAEARAEQDELVVSSLT